MNSSRFVFLLTALFICEQHAHAQTKRRPPVSGDRQIQINYASAPWNKDSVRIDSAFLFVRDTSSQKVLKIVLEESEPDSSLFSGRFSLRWAENQEITPEVYIPPREMRDDEQAVNKFMSLLTENKINRKPTVFRKEDDGKQYLDVFDTKEQATRAHEAYKEQLRLKKQTAQKGTGLKPIPSEQALEAEALGKIAAEKRQEAIEAARKESERIQLEQLEKQKMEARRKELESLHAAELEKRKQEAEALAAEAMAKYSAGDFGPAEELFRKAVDLDPSNKSFYYSYGVALYKNQKYNDSLVVLRLTHDSAVNPNEKLFYIGLNYYRLKEQFNALKTFDEVRAGKDPVVSPSASFYKGVIYFEEKQWEASKASFEETLDTSKDPKLDEQAEAFIEQIAQMQAFQAEQEKKWIVSGMLGLNYDSNILLVPDSGTGTAQDKAGIRGLGSFGLEYRPFYEMNYEWSAKMNVLGMYTLNSDFHKADPFIVSAWLPYVYKGTAWGKGYKMELAPGYESLFMDPNNSKETSNLWENPNILNSLLLNNNHTFIMRDNWFSNYALEIRKDDSLLPDSTGADDSSAMKYTLKTTQTLFIDKEKKRAILGEVGYTLNDAEGTNKKYNRYDFAVGYLKPIMWDMMWNNRLAVYRIIYPDETNNRKDTDVALTTGITKKINDWMSALATVTYTVNGSTDENSQYNKFSVISALVFSDKF